MPLPSLLFTGRASTPENADIVAKFEQSVAPVAEGATARRVREAVLGLGDDRPAAEFAEACRAG